MISRRRVLLLGSTGLLMGVGGVLRWRSQHVGDQIKDGLTNLLSEQPAAAEIGREYLRLFPEERAAGDLVVRILGSHRERVWSTTELKEVVDRRVRDDFAAGETVRIRGWILSRTEARVAALMSLP